MNKFLSLIAAVIFAAISATFSVATFAKDGPNLASLVTIDESKFDLNKKNSIGKSDVLNRLTKETFNREIFEVKEFVQTAYIVRESQPVARTVTEEREVYVRVTKVPKVDTPGWSYINR